VLLALFSYLISVHFPTSLSMASFLNGRPVLQWLLVRWEQSFKTYKANDCQQCETDRNRFKKQVISEAIGQLVQT